ncbi:cyclin-dependent kinase inhibitor [Musa troglodytarum]|uniref:Cyclin-dependent kinase inhibitor n=1 Tax=Musa troglodytarum TaxID=320322 RepID=A0A9E7EE86_9LILI|nr:cyclin-dependent kinase inhibitor [Musa troglodytarum]
MTKAPGSGMARYSRKARIGGEAAVADAAHQQSSFGVHTRAKTLALKRLQESSPADAYSYLQLRSRRLQKHLPAPSSVRSRPAAKNTPSANPNSGRTPKFISNPPAGMGESPVTSDSAASVSMRNRCLKKAKASSEAAAAAVPEVSSKDRAGSEASYGENVLELEASSSNLLRTVFVHGESSSNLLGCRSARESTPCSLIRNSETIGSPGSTTRPTKFTVSSKRQASPIVPTGPEMEELFAGPEQLQQRRFMERYNFDVAKDQPLPGRYEWVKLDS